MKIKHTRDSIQLVPQSEYDCYQIGILTTKLAVFRLSVIENKINYLNIPSAELVRYLLNR